MIPIPATFKINPLDPRPIYEQYVVHIVYLYDKNILHAGDRLPPERELAAKLNISRGTLKKAFEILKRQGYLECLQGSGNYITDPARQQKPSETLLRQVWHACERCFSELRALDLPNKQVFALMHDYLNEVEQKYAEVSLAMIGYTSETLSCYRAQLADLEHLHINTYVINDLERSPTLLAQVAENDLIFTGSAHLKQIQAMLPQCIDRIYPFAVSPSASTMVRMATLPAGMQSAIVCQNMRFFQVVRETLDEVVPEHRDPICLMTDFDGMVPRHISGEIDVLIINSQSRLLKESHPALEEFTARGGRILKYSYEMDQGSRMLLESTVRQAYQRKLLDSSPNTLPRQSASMLHI